MKRTQYILGLVMTLFVIGCGHSDETHVHDDGTVHYGEGDSEGHDDHAEPDENEVHLMHQQVDVIGIELGGFQSVNLSTTVKANGQLEVPPQNKASLSAVMHGRVTNIAVLEGDQVTKGQTLVTLEHPDYLQIQQEYMTAKSRLDFLEQDYLRKKELFEDSLSSAKAYQEAESVFLSEKASVSGLKAKLQMLDIDTNAAERGDFVVGIPVRSPINGYVHNINVNIGKFVEPQEQMLEIVDNEHIHMDLMVFEKDMGKVKIGQRVLFSMSNNSDSLFEGSIFAVGKSFEHDPKAMVVHAEIDNPGGNLLPGMYVDARIITNEDKVRALPNEAVVNDGGLTYIFILQAETHEEEGHEDDDHEDEVIFSKTEVHVRATDIGFSEVVPIFDLPDDAQIVVKGAFYLIAEMKKGQGGHGHAH